MAAPRPQGDLDPLVQELLNETKPGEDEHSTRCKRYDHSYEVYRASRPIPRDLPDYRSRLRPKYAMNTIDVAMVNMVQDAPKFKVLPRTPSWIDSSRLFQLLMDYYVEQDHLAEKMPVTVQQALVYGVTVGKTHWLYQERDVRRPVTDTITGAQTVETQTVVLRDGPSYEPWDVYDAWWDPNARTVDSAEWVALRTWASKTYLEQNRCTVTGAHEWWECDGLYHNVDALYQTGAGRQRYTPAQDRLLGGSTNLKKDRFELVEYWRDDRLTVVGNRQIPMRDMPNPHEHGRKPVCVATCRPDGFKMQGIAETELVEDIQDALHTLENIRQENIHLTTWRALTLRDSSGLDPNTVEIKPRAIIPVGDHDDLKPIEVPPFPPEAYQEEQVLKQTMQDLTGISPYVSGAALGTVNQNTATGVSILNSAASVLLRFKAQQVQNGIGQRTCEQWGADIQQFMSRKVAVRLTGEAARRMTGNPTTDFAFVDAAPQDVAGEYDYKLEGSEESLSKAQDRQDAIQLTTALAPLIQIGIINPKPIVEKIARAFGIDDPESLLVPAQTGQAPPAAPFPNGNTPPQPPGPGQTLTHGMPLPGQVGQAVMNGG